MGKGIYERMRVTKKYSENEKFSASFRELLVYKIYVHGGQM